MLRAALLRVFVSIFILSFVCGLLSVSTGCARHQETLVGFEGYGSKTAAEEAEKIVGDIQTIESALRARFLEGAESDARSLEQHYAARALLGAYLALSNERIDYENPKQAISPGRPPIFLYPRLTSPAIVEPRLVGELAADAGETEMKWLVPIILNKNARYWDESFTSVWLGLSPRREYWNRPQEPVATWLVIHGDVPVEERRPIFVDDYVLKLEPVEVELASGITYSLPHQRDGIWGGVLAIPARDSQGAGVKPGFYDLRVFPQISCEPTSTAFATALARQLAEGDWYEAHRVVKNAAESQSTWVGEDRRRAEKDLLAIAEAVEDHPVPWSQPERSRVSRALRRCADAAASDSEGAMPRALRALEQALRHMLKSDPHPAPVLLDDPAERGEPFSFVVAADFQYRGDMKNVRRVLRTMDPTLVPGDHAETVTGHGHPDLEFDSDRSMVGRTSDYVDERTFVLGCEFAAEGFNRDLVTALENGLETVVTVEVE